MGDSDVKVHRAWAGVCVLVVLAFFGFLARACDNDREIIKACVATHPPLECARLSSGQR